MKTREILSIVALAALGLCLLCGLAKMAMKNPKAKQSCDHACSLLVFVAVVLVGVSQLIEEEGYKELNLPYWEPGVGALPWTFSGEGKMKHPNAKMGLGDPYGVCSSSCTCCPANMGPCQSDSPGDGKNPCPQGYACYQGLPGRGGVKNESCHNLGGCPPGYREIREADGTITCTAN